MVHELSDRFVRAGRKLYLVGGTVRDALLGLPHEDLDFATDATPDQVVKVVEAWADELWLVGVRFGTVGLTRAGTKVEITTLRSEIYPEPSRHPEVVFESDIERDLSRRDFTINALAVEVPSGRLVDPFGGRGHLERRILETPAGAKQSFLDDPLRMLRAARFVATLEMRVSAGVKRAMRAYHEALRIVSKERIRDELSKLLVGKKAVTGLRLLLDTDLASEVLPELLDLKVAQDPDYHHKDIFEHTLVVVDRVPPDLPLRLAALLHDVGKPSTRAVVDGKVTFYNHDMVGAHMAKKRLMELRYPRQVVDEVFKLVSLHMRAYTYRLGWTDKAVRKYIRDVGPLLTKLHALIRADCTTKNPEKMREALAVLDELQERITELEAAEESAKIRPPIDGHEVMVYLGIKPGPMVGEILDLLLDAKLDGAITTKEDAYAFVEKWAKEKGIKD